MGGGEPILVRHSLHHLQTQMGGQRMDEKVTEHRFMASMETLAVCNFVLHKVNY